MLTVNVCPALAVKAHSAKLFVSALVFTARKGPHRLADVGCTVGRADGAADGAVGCTVGGGLGSLDASVGLAVGSAEGAGVGMAVVGRRVGTELGASELGASVG
jgi:hypothetical protein